MRKFLLPIAALVGIGLVFVTGTYLPSQPDKLPAAYHPGSYTATVPAAKGDLTLSVQLGENVIESATVLSHQETKGIGDRAIEQILRTLLMRQSLAVDLVSGATLTSNAVVQAATEAIGQGLNHQTIASLTARPDETEVGTIAPSYQRVDADVVVVGAGAAGMSAAIAAHDAGKTVVLLEKTGEMGGNLRNASYGLNATGTPAQKRANIEDDTDRFAIDALKVGDRKNDRELLDVFTEQADEAVAWLGTLGAPLPRIREDTVRAHLPADDIPVGEFLLTQLSAAIAERQIPIYYHTEAKRIIAGEKGVEAIQALQSKDDTGTPEEFLFVGKATILATGGFGGDSAKVGFYLNQTEGFSTAVTPWATGDALNMLQNMGIATTEMENIHLYPMVNVANGQNISTRILDMGGILLNQNGKRFCDEADWDRKIAAAALQQEEVTLLFTLPMLEALQQELPDFPLDQCTVSQTIEALAEQHNLPLSAMQTEISRRNAAVAQGVFDHYGRRHITDLAFEEGPYYSMTVQPGVYETTGGLLTNTSGQVLTTAGACIPGLYAAGDVTGGLHGTQIADGNGLSGAFVFGKITGEAAANQ